MQLFLHKNLQQHMQKFLAHLVLFSLLALSSVSAHEATSAAVKDDNSSLLQLNSDVFTTTRGLSQNTVTSVAQDQKGFIWIGTLNGLNRFDGTEFKKYYADENSNLNSSFIHSLEIFNGQLFIGTDKSLVKLNDETEKFESVLDIGEPITFLENINEKLLIGTTTSIIILDNKEQISLNLKDQNINFVKQFYEVNNTFYIRNHDGSILEIKDNPRKIVKLAQHSIALGKKNDNIIIHKKDGVYELLSGIITKISSKTYGSVTYRDNTSVYLTENRVELNSKFNSFTGVLDDNFSFLYPLLFPIEKGLIIASMNNGFLYIPDHKNIIRTGHMQKENNIWFVESHEDALIVSDDTSKIKVLDPNNLNIIFEIETLTEGFKATAKIDKDNMLYCSSKGIYKFNTLDNSHQKISDVKAFSIAYEPNKNLIYVGTSEHSVKSIDLASGEERIILETNNPIFQIKIGKNGRVYVSHQGGLSTIDNQGLSIQQVLSNHIVYGVDFDLENIFIATENGVMKSDYKNKSFEYILKTEKPIYSLGVDKGWVFASSINEISVITPDKIYTLHSSNGAQSEYNNQSFGRYKDGVIFGGIQGLSFLKLKDFNSVLKTAENRLDTNFTALFLFNNEVHVQSDILKRSIDESDEITLRYSDYPFAIQFSTPKYSNSNVTHYYRLKGLSDEWVGTQRSNVATYTNLSPGRYTFEVYAKDNLSQISGPLKSIAIRVTPPWWMSTEAKVAYALLTILITTLLLKAVLRRREVQRQIAISEERLKLSLWGSGDEMWDWDIETGKIYRSNIWGSLEFPKDGHRSGRGDEESNIHPQDQERVREALNRHFYGETDHFEAAYRVKGKDGHWVWILDRAKIVERDDSDNALRMTGTIKNINNFKQAEEQLKLFERAIENISEGMFILDNDFRFVEVNEACCDICMLDRGSFIGTVLHFACYPDVYSEQVRIILRQQGRWSAEVESKRGDSSTFLMELTVDAIYDEQGTLSHFVGVFSDISRRKMQEEELRKLTNNDLLTGLPNRSNLQVSLSNLVKKDTHHTLMVLDLDNFKKINDSLGHQIGDELLLMVSRRMSGALPAHTSLYRLGGDEFAILIDKEPDIGSSAAIAKGVVDAFVAPFELAGEKLVVGVSIGIVLYPEDEQNEQALLRKADIAMYHAKSAGGNRYQFYSESLNRNAMRQLEVENLIREGLRDDLFEVYYQPKIDLRNSRMAGMEALVRLVHPVQGLIPPSEFIPLAEETGLIVEIGDLVMRKACFAAQKWREQGIFDGRVAVNLSSRQFALPDLQQRIESILRLTQLPAANLELEITEGTVIKQPEKAIKVMQQLAKMGVSLALDDFGTGYSSLSYLKRFPIHTLKIDKAFVDDIDKSDRDLKMVDSIITIAHNMGLTVVGEGVEVPSQLNILRALKCEEIQGYIYSKAVPEHEFTELLQQDLAEFLAQKYNQR